MGVKCPLEEYIDYAKLAIMLADFFRLTNIRIGFWDSRGRHCLVSCGESCSEFCQRIQLHPGLLAACGRCEREGLEQAKAQPLVLHHFHCHAGMKEFIFPVEYEGNVLGYFMYGQVRITDMRNDREARARMYDRFHLEAAGMEALYNQLPTVETAFMEAAGRMLGNLAKYSHLSGLIQMRNSILSDQIRDYIELNHTQPLTVDAVSRHFFVSPSTLSHTLAKEQGTTFVAMLNDARIEAVKRRITQGDSISDAAFRAGFRTENYMSRVFKQKEGMTPSQYRDSFLRKKN
jgi:AraC-like DNA-binding protein